MMGIGRKIKKCLGIGGNYKINLDPRQNLICDEFQKLTQIILPNGNPNLNAVSDVLRHHHILTLNVKNMGYALARLVSNELPSCPIPEGPTVVRLESKASLQADIESDWLRYWANQLGTKPIYHRKLWELCYVPQALFETGCLQPGKIGLGFACGSEPLPSLFAKLGARVVVTDLAPDEAAGKGWIETGQHSSSLDDLKYGHICDEATFERNVSLRFLDMNNIPEDTHSQYDFCWSVCALEHLGSIEKGLDFIENSMSVLKPGGVAVHTTEYNFSSIDYTIDNWDTVLFQRKHFEQIAKRMEDRGYHIRTLNFSTGNGLLDQFIDIPPFDFHGLDIKNYINQPSVVTPHLKLSIDGIPSTCFGLIIEKSCPVNRVDSTC